MTQQPLTSDDLARIEELAEKAGSGWEIYPSDALWLIEQLQASVAGVRSLQAEVAEAHEYFTIQQTRNEYLQARITELETEKADAWLEGAEFGRTGYTRMPFPGDVYDTHNPYRAGVDHG